MQKGSELLAYILLYPTYTEHQFQHPLRLPCKSHREINKYPARPFYDCFLQPCNASSVQSHTRLVDYSISDSCILGVCSVMETPCQHCFKLRGTLMETRILSELMLICLCKAIVWSKATNILFHTLNYSVVDITCSCFCWADAADLVRFREFASIISKKLPAEDGGSRFARVFDQYKKHKLHDLFVFAGGLGAYLAHLARVIGWKERRAYTMLYLVCGELWAKVIYKYATTDSDILRSCSQFQHQVCNCMLHFFL